MCKAAARTYTLSRCSLILAVKKDFGAMLVAAHAQALPSAASNVIST